MVGLILDTCVLIAAERQSSSIGSLLRRIRSIHGEIDIALSTVSVVELTHGIHRARTPAEQFQRRVYANEAITDLIIHPVSLEIAQLAGKIDGEEAAKGFTIPFEDLIIGVTALHFGFDVATLNAKHFQLIPGLQIVTL
jgi:tRNA(fMet)-specific endonuclease VapC